MADGTVVRADDVDDGWDAFVARSAGAHHAQTSRWGAVQARRGWEVHRLAVHDGDSVVAGAQVLTKGFGGLGRVAYVDHGPLGAEPDGTAGTVVLDRLEQFCRDHAVRLLMVQPPDHSRALEPALRSRRFGPTHLKTALAATTTLDLARTEDELLAAMKSKTRYNLRRALRAGVSVREGTRDDVAVFHQMLVRTAERQGFVPNSKGHLHDVFDTLGDWCRVFLAEVDGVAVSGMLAMTFGDTVVYKRGAWSGEAGDKHPNEAMHWAAIRWARDNGFARYDFDGIEPDAARAVLAGGDLPGSAVDSVTRFKLGFNGDVVLLPETLSYVPNRVLRFGYQRLYPEVADLGPVKRLVKRVRVG